MAGIGTVMGINAIANLGGGIVRGLMANDPYQVDPTYTQSFYEGDPRFSQAGEESAGRIGDISNPYATGALWDQEWLRQEQERRMEDLRARAFGERSVAREESAAMQDDMQAMLRGTGRGGGRFDRADLQTQAFKEEAMLPSSMWSDTEAQARQERNQAQNDLFNYQQQQQAANRSALSSWGNLQNIENEQQRAQRQTQSGYEQLAGSALKWRTGGGVQEQQNKATKHKNS